MPPRPLSHQLEERSRSAFRSKLPPAWTLSEIKDYGVDGQVEVFTPAGEHTGLFFAVQFKATSKSSTKRAVSAKLTRRLVNYYRSLPMPLLMVRYHADSERFFIRWFHSRALAFEKGQESVSFRFDAADEWTAGTAANLQAELELFRRLKPPGFPAPLTFSVRFESGSVAGHSQSALDVELRKQVSWVSDLLGVSRSALTYAHPSIAFGDTKDVVSLAGLL